MARNRPLVDNRFLLSEAARLQQVPVQARCPLAAHHDRTGVFRCSHVAALRPGIGLTSRFTSVFSMRLHCSPRRSQVMRPFPAHAACRVAGVSGTQVSCFAKRLNRSRFRLQEGDSCWPREPCQVSWGQDPQRKGTLLMGEHANAHCNNTEILQR